MESLAKAILKALEKSSNSGLSFKLPVETICGIKVYAEFKVHKHNGKILSIAFNIESYDISDNDDSNTIFSRTLARDFKQTTVTVEEIIPCIEQILAIIPTLKFDKKRSTLTDEDILEDEVVELFRFENTTICEVCCVCHDLTNSKTECGHPLCLVCMSSLDENFEGGERTKSCPLCREYMSFIHY